MPEYPLYPARRAHLDELTGSLGIWQHAIGTRPNREFGTCTDDVSRALIVDLLHYRELGWPAVEATAWLGLAYLRDASNPKAGRFHNFRAADGRWLDSFGSEDSHARALEALGQALALGPDPRFVIYADELFERALPAAEELGELRPIAAALLGCDAALRAGAGEAAARMFHVLAERLKHAFSGVGPDWPWPAPIVTYENGLLPRALIVAAERLADEELLASGLRSLRWLADAQTVDSHLSLVGNEGWWPRGGARATFDQQPIDATALLLAAEAALTATAEDRYRDLAEMAYGWFLGRNDLGVEIADPATGGCHDALCRTGANGNQGAESTLMWLTALEHMRLVRAADRPTITIAASSTVREAQ